MNGSLVDEFFSFPGWKRLWLYFTDRAGMWLDTDTPTEREAEARELLNEAWEAIAFTRQSDAHDRGGHSCQLSELHHLGEARAALDEIVAQLAHAERLNGELRAAFRRRMREWREHGREYSYDEEDVEQFLLTAEREADLPTVDDITGILRDA